MSNEGARRAEDDMEPEIEIADPDDSLVTDRTPKAPAMLRLGRYRVVCELASGGMATVNLAIADGLDKLLALKIIHPHLAKEDSFVHMFLDEARIASSVTHRNVCNVFDYGEQDGRYYMAMDYLAGSTLRDVIRRLRGRRNKLSGQRLAAYVSYIISQACEGLHAAHELRDNQGALMDVVHRDVSPHNLFVTYDGNVSVVDFGIARASDRLQQTATGVLKGKFSYMAPEQIRQSSIDRRADIWALGVCLWEALTQRRLFVRATQADTLMSVMMDAIKPPSEVDPTLPRELDAIVLKALSRNPEERYRTARDMGRDLIAFCREHGENIGPVEIEQFMLDLFPKEVVQSQELVRRAKQSAADELLEHSLARPYPTQSGAIMRPSMARAMSRTLTGGTPVSAIGYADFPGSLPPQMEARPTTVPAQGQGRLRGFAWGAGFAVALGLALYFILPSRQAAPPPVPVASDENLPVVGPHPVLPTPAAPPKPAAIVAPSQPEEAAKATAPVEDPQPAPSRPAPAAQRASAPSRPSPARAAQLARAQRAQHEAAEPAVDAQVREPRAALEVDSDLAALSQPVVAPPEPKAIEIPAPTAPAPKPVAPAPKPTAAEVKPQPKPDNRPLDAVASIGNVQTQGSLVSSVVGRMLSRGEPLMRSCYKNAARASGQNDFAPLSFSFKIDEAGLVRAPKASSHPLPGLSGCVSDALKRLRSDQKPDVGIVKVEAQVSFRPL